MFGNFVNFLQDLRKQELPATVARTSERPPAPNLSGLSQPGIAAQKTTVALSPVIAPRPSVEAAPVVPQPISPAPRPIDWAEESRIDLPPHSPAEIAELLKYESPEQTQARIRVDSQRYWNQRGQS